MSTKNCIIYCRVSSKEQVEGTSLETQEQRCLEYAKRMDWQVAQIFNEQGESAKTADRTEFNKAINFCTKKQNTVDVFLVYKLDRFARNTEDHIVVRGILQKSGTELKSVTEHTDNTPIGRAMENIAAVFAELDNSTRAERSKSGMIARVKEGKWCWPPPLGYHKLAMGKGTNITPDPDIAPLITRAFEEYAKGIYTYRELAEYMAKKGLRTKHNKQPTFQMMDKIIHNPAYMGKIVAFGEEIEGAFDPLIDEPTFNVCQNIVDGKKHKAKPRSMNNPEFPLRGFVRCGQCQKKITASKSTGRRGKKYAYYHHSTKDKCPLCRSIPKPIFEQMFIEYLDSLTPNEEYLVLFKQAVMDIWQSNYKQFNSSNAKVNNEIARLDDERQKVFDMHRNGTYSDEDFQQQKNVIDERIKQKRSQLETCWSDEVNMDVAMEYSLNFITNASKIWLEADYKEKIQLQGSTFPSGIEFDGERYRTADISLIYKLKETPLAEKSLLVARRGIEPLFSP